MPLPLLIPGEHYCRNRLHITEPGTRCKACYQARLDKQKKERRKKAAARAYNKAYKRKKAQDKAKPLVSPFPAAYDASGRLTVPFREYGTVDQYI